MTDGPTPAGDARAWHAPVEMLDRYADGALPEAAAWSLEAHVSVCSQCRRVLAAQGVGPTRARLETIWRRVSGELDRPAPGLVEGALRRLGVPEHLGRLLAATPSLTVSWLLGVAGVLAVAVAAAWVGDRDPLLFLTLAPLVPLAGVAVAFGPGVDPTYEIGLAAPLRSGRLLLIRAVAVTASSLVLAAIGALALPVVSWTVAAWVLPAVATTTVMLAASTWVAPPLAAGGVAAVWLGVVAATELGASGSLAAFDTAGQVAATGLATAAVVVLAVRRRSFDRARG